MAPAKFVVFKFFRNFHDSILRFDSQNVYVLPGLPNLNFLQLCLPGLPKTQKITTHLTKTFAHQKAKTKSFCDTSLLKLKFLENFENALDTANTPAEVQKCF